MKGRFSSHPVGMGTTSLLATFVIFCLISFSVLSYTTAKNDETMAIRAMDAMASYYTAENQGEERLGMAMTAYQQGDPEILHDLGIEVSSAGGNLHFSWAETVSDKKVLVYDVTIQENGAVERRTRVVTE